MLGCLWIPTKCCLCNNANHPYNCYIQARGRRTLCERLGPGLKDELGARWFQSMQWQSGVRADKRKKNTKKTGNVSWASWHEQQRSRGYQKQMLIEHLDLFIPHLLHKRSRTKIHQVKKLPTRRAASNRKNDGHPVCSMDRQDQQNWLKV